MLIAGLFITIYATLFIKSDVDTLAEKEFSYQSHEISNRMNSRLHAHAQVLRSATALFSISDTVTREQWKTFIEGSKIQYNLPGIQGIGFSLIIAGDNLQQHIQKIRDEGFPEYSVKPEGMRETYTSIVFLEPFQGRNLRAFGYDMFSDSVRREAMERARDMDVAALSGKVLLVQETGTEIQAGNLMYVPVYRKGAEISTVGQRRLALKGWVYSPYRMNDLMSGILKDWEQQEYQKSILQIFDGPECTPQSLLFESDSTTAQSASEKVRFTIQIPVDFNGHLWTLVFTQGARNSFIDYRIAWTILFGGTLISILLFFLARSIINTNYRARQIAEKLTIELKVSEGKYRLLAEASPEMIYLIDTKGYVTYLNNTAAAQFQAPAQELIGKHLKEIFPPDLAQQNLKGIQNVIATKNSSQREVELVFPAGNRWVDARLTPVFDEKNSVIGVLGLSYDITGRKLIDEKLKESEELYRNLVNTINDGIFETDINGIITFSNNALAEILGFNKAEEVIGHDFIEYIPQDKMAEIAGKYDNDIISETPIHSVEVEIQRLDGKAVYLGIKSVLIWEKDKVIGTRGVIRDITTQKQLEKNLYHTLIQTSLDGFCITDFSGQILDTNEALCRMLGYTREELLGMNIYEIEINETSGETGNYIRQIIETGSIRFQSRSRCKDGAVIVVDINIQYVPELGEKLYSFIRDITQQKKYEEELETATEKALVANMAKSEFLSNMSHEIRTPMNAILGYTQLLESQLTDKTQRKYMESIRTSGKTLLTLINDILDLSRIEAGKLELRFGYVDTDSFFGELKNIFSAPIDEKGLNFILDIRRGSPASLYVDEIRLRQVLVNLIGNALKFTDKGYIKLSVWTENPRILKTGKDKAEESADLIIEVEDTGIGISREYQEKIFDPFRQQDGQDTRKHAGTGMGLNISRRLTELMKGTISVESVLNKGSTFRVFIPDVPFVQDLERKEPELSFDPESILFEEAKIIVADDVSQSRRIIIDILKHTSLKIYEADNGEQAFNIAKEIIPDLIIADIRMPVMDGFELLKKLKKDKKLKLIPVIAYSASVMKSSKDKIRTSKFAALLSKPIKIVDLFTELMKYLPYQDIGAEKETDPGKEIEFRIEAVENMPELVATLETKLLKQWETFSRRQPMNEVKEFGVRLIELGEKHKAPIPAEYGKKLITATDIFDVKAIQRLLRQYPELLKRFRKIRNT